QCELRVIGVDQSKLKSVNVRTIVDSKRQDTIVPAYVEHSSRRGRCRRHPVDISLAIDVNTVSDAHCSLRHRSAFSERQSHVRGVLKAGSPASVQYIPRLAEQK